MAATIVLVLAGCGSTDNRFPTAADLERIDTTVDVRWSLVDGGAEPTPFEVEAGDLIEVRNADDVARWIDGGSVFSTGRLLPGETMLLVFDEPGRINWEDRETPAAGVIEVVPPASGH